MIIDPNDTSGRDLYRLMISTVLPRPIAWISTRSADGQVNVAPFSYFQIVGSRPPMVSVCIGVRKWQGEVVKKDTLRNIEDTGELVINIATEDTLEQLNQTSAEYPPDISEAAEVGLTTIPSDLVAPPRIAESPVHLECKRERVLMLGDEPRIGMVIAEVVRFHVADALWDAEAGAIDPRKLRPLARLGGTSYARLGEIVERPRPELPPRA